MIYKTKKELRSCMRLLLKDFFSDQNKVLLESNKASQVFLDSALYKNAKIVMAFVSAKNEIETLPILHKAMADNKKVLVPRVFSETEMDFFYLQNNLSLSEQLITGSFDIQEPANFLERFIPSDELAEKTIMLVPGLAFSKDGSRLGKGKGFYDRYLNRFKPKVRCAFCFDFQEVDFVPTDNFDVRVTHIVHNKMNNIFEVLPY